MLEAKQFRRQNGVLGTSSISILAFQWLLFSHSVMSNSLWTHRLQHTRLPYPWLSSRVYSNSCPLIWWCHPTVLSSVIPFSSRLQSFPASGSFPMSQLFASGGQSIGTPASASVLPMNIQSCISFRIDWFDPVAVQGTLESLLQHHSSKAPILWHSAFFVDHVSSIHDYCSESLCCYDGGLWETLPPQTFGSMYQEC